MAEELVAFDEIDPTLARSPRRREHVPAAAEVAPKEEKPTLLEFGEALVKRDFAGHAIARAWVDSGFEDVGDFDLEADVPEKEWEELTARFDDDTKERLASAAKSRSHLYFLVDHANEAMDHEETMAQYGAWGVGARFAAELVKPENYGLAMATGGVGVAVRAERLARSARRSLDMMERRKLVGALETASKTSRRAQTAGVAVATGIENMLLESVLINADATRDEWDVAFAGIGGAVVGGGVGRMLSGRELSRAQKLWGVEKARLENAELKAAIDKARGDLKSTVGDVDAVRAEVHAPYIRAAGFLGGRDVDLADYPKFRHILESGGRADAANPNSTAVGIDQFTEGTWLGIVGQTKPEWAKGLSREQLLDLRKDPAKSAEMVAALDAQNTAALRKAGAPVNHFTLYALHHFGPSKGIRFAKASPDTLMDDILSAAQLKANPYLKGKTKAEAMGNWARRAKKGGVDLDAPLKQMADDVDGAQLDAEIAGFDADGTNARISEIEARLARHDELAAGEAGRLSQGEVRRLSREVEKLQRELNGGRKTKSFEAAETVKQLQRQLDELAEKRDARIEALAKEDDLKLGREISRSKHRTKIRESVVDKRNAADRKKLEALLGKAQHTHKAARYAAKERLGELLPRINGVRELDDLKKNRKGLEGEREQLRQALGLHTEKVAKRDELKKAREAEKAARDDILAHLGVVRDKEQALDKLDAFDQLDEAAQARQLDLDTKGRAAAFGADTLSAARVVGFDPGLHPGIKDTAVGAVDRMKLADGVSFFGLGTFSGILRGHDNAAVRDNLGLIVGNALGNVGDTVSEHGASEVTHRILKSMTGKFHAAMLKTYPAWMKENGISKAKIFNRSVRRKFMEDVGLTIRGEGSGSPAAEQAAGRVRELFREFLDMAKEAGVKGFENVSEDPNWLPRVFNFQKFDELIRRVGPDQLEDLFTKAIKNARPDLEDVLAARIGKAYVKRMRNLRMGNDPNLLQGLSFDDAGAIRQLLRDAEVDSAQIEEVMTAFAQGKHNVAKQEGSFRHAKHRQRMDENFTVTMRDKIKNDGSTVDVTVSQLFENNIEQLFGRYSRTMSGHIGLAKVGIKSRGDFDERLRRVEDALEHDKPEWERIRDRANAAYDILTARPLQDSTVWTEIYRTSRDLSYGSQMENVALANIPDIAALLAWGNIRHTLDAFFSGDVFRMWARDENGRLKNDFLREIEEVFGLGTDHLNNQIHSSYDVTEDPGVLPTGDGASRKVARAVGSGFQTVSHGARVVSRGVTLGSGMAALGSFSQRLNARNIIYRMKDDLFKGGRFSEARSAALGLDGAMKKRIEDQMRKHTAWVDGEVGGKIQRVDFVKWDDLEARDAFLGAVHREARKNIQETDLGDTMLWQNYALGKVVSQFRMFGLTAWTKQTMRGIAEHDAEAMTRAAMQMVLAASVWKLRHEAVIQGMELAGADSDRIEEYRERNLTGTRIGAAAIRNSGVAALLPDLYDTTFGAATGSPVFDVRNSGNSSHLLMGVPAIAWWSNMGRAATGTLQALLREDREMTTGTFTAIQALIPFANHILTAPAFEAVRGELPTSHGDDDPEDAEFIWE